LFSYHSVYTIINFYITYIRARSLTHTHTHTFSNIFHLYRAIYITESNEIGKEIRETNATKMNDLVFAFYVQSELSYI